MPTNPRTSRTRSRCSRLNHVVITSVDRDDLRDGGAAHFAACIRAVRKRSPGTRIEVLVPDFRGRLAVALEILAAAPPDVLNHNLETVPRLYREARPGADYAHSLELLRAFKARRPDVPDEIRPDAGAGRDRRRSPRGDARPAPATTSTCSPSASICNRAPGNLPVRRYVPPAAFGALEARRARNGVRARGLWSAGPLQLSRRPPGAGGRRPVTRSSTPEIRSIE